MSSVLFRKEFKKYDITEYKDQCDINRIYEEYDSQVLHSLDKDSLWSRPIFQMGQTYHDEESFQRNIKNQLCSIFTTKVLIVVEEKEEKVAFKLFTSYFEKRVGKQWFKVNKNVDYISVNRKTGDIYVGYIHGYHKKRKVIKAVRRNFFSNEFLSGMASKIKNFGNTHIPNAAEIANEASDIFINSIVSDSSNLTREQKIFKFYLDKKGFKYPNNFNLYRNIYWDKNFKKILKKNNKKLVDSLMTLYGVHGKKLKKYLHQSIGLNVPNYVFCSKFFGEDWLNQSEDAILKLLNYEPNLNLPDEVTREFFSPKEIRKIFNMVINSVCESQIDVYTFNDHVRMYLDLKRYGENTLEWTTDGSNYSKFHEEHLDWTDKLEHYRRGTYDREYPKYFYEQIERPIEDYLPVILKNSNEYNSESQVQSNCVKGYIGRPYSFIVSLRKGGIDSDVRATIEYRILKKDDKIIANNVQTLGKFNMPLDESWNRVILKLNEIVLLSHQDKRFEPVKIRKECANGTILNSDSHFDEMGILRWSYKKDDLFTYQW